MMSFVEMCVAVVKGEMPTWEMVAAWKQQALTAQAEVIEISLRKDAEKCSALAKKDEEIVELKREIEALKQKVDATIKACNADSVNQFHTGYEHGLGRKLLEQGHSSPDVPPEF